MRRWRIRLTNVGSNVLIENWEKSSSLILTFFDWENRREKSEWRLKNGHLLGAPLNCRCSNFLSRLDTKEGNRSRNRIWFLLLTILTKKKKPYRFLWRSFLFPSITSPLTHFVIFSGGFFCTREKERVSEKMAIIGQGQSCATVKTT